MKTMKFPIAGLPGPGPTAPAGVSGSGRVARVRLHDLRHSHATQLLASGVHPKIASESLGHSSIAITLDIYSHVTQGMQSDAASKVDAVLDAALHRRRNTKG